MVHHGAFQVNFSFLSHVSLMAVKFSRLTNQYPRVIVFFLSYSVFVESLAKIKSFKDVFQRVV